MVIKKKRIGWQKYEDVLESQLTSPLIGHLLSSMISKVDIDEEQTTDIYKPEDEEEEQQIAITNPFLSLSEDLLSDISMITNYDCWVGHANFDITPTVKDILDRVDGVEILKICSRYRFFIGVGKMFKFKSVRKDLEKQLLN